MAFILADENTLARDLWPDQIGSTIQERGCNTQTLPSSRKIPSDVDQLAEWLWVDHQPQLSSAYVYVRSDVDGEGVGKHAEGDVQLVVRFQGVITDMNLSLGGNWDGSESNTMKALQHLTLSDGRFPVPFKPQVAAAKAIREVVLLSLGKCDFEDKDKGGSINLRRTVFTKIRTGVNDHAMSVVKLAEDPKRKFRAINSTWRIVSSVTTVDY
ncbi:hypothetical protein C8Q79DRAFT_1008780 [Trametes meyenii]|nr:hypothetical protein C8Q79DRAFT_1008780 [Trametes meyenii]